MVFNFRVEGLRRDERSGVHIRQVVKPSLDSHGIFYL